MKLIIALLLGYLLLAPSFAHAVFVGYGPRYIVGTAAEACHTSGTVVSGGSWQATVQAGTAGTTFLMAAGTGYTTSSTLTIPAGVNLFAENCATVEITFTGSSGDMLSLAGDNIIAGLRLMTTTRGQFTLISGFKNNITIRNNYIRGGTGSGVVRTQGGCNGVLFQGNDVRAGEMAGSYFSHLNNAGSTGVGGCSNVHILDNSIRGDLVPETRTGEDVIAFGGCTGCSAQYNLIFNIQNAENFIDIKQQHTSPVLIKGNHIQGPFLGTFGGNDGGNIATGVCIIVGDHPQSNYQMHMIEDNLIEGDCSYKPNAGVYVPIAVGSSSRFGRATILRLKVLGTTKLQATPQGRILQTDDTRIYHSTFINSGIRLLQTFCPAYAFNVQIKNNIFDNSTVSDTTDGCPTSEYVATNNIFNTITGGFERGTVTGTITADPLLNNADGTLQAGSPAINAGVAISGVGNCNGACDIGADEAFFLSGADVGLVAPDKIVLTFENNLHPPLVASDFLTGWTARENTVNAPLSSAALQGTNQIVITTSSPLSSGTTVDVSYNSATGNLTDRVGQKFFSATNFPVTNSITGGGGGTVDDTTTHRQSAASASWTFNHTTGVGATAIVVACYADTTSQAGGIVPAPTVTFNSDALAVDVYNQHINRRSAVGIFSRSSPDIGTHAVLVVWSSAQTGGCFARSFEGTGTPLIQGASFQQTTSTVASISTNVSCPSGSGAIAMLGTGLGGDLITVTTPQDEIMNEKDPKAYVGASTPGIGTTTIAYSWTGGLVGSNMAIACVLADQAPAPTNVLAQSAYRFTRENNVIAVNAPLSAVPGSIVLVEMELSNTVAAAAPFGAELWASTDGETDTVIPLDYGSGIVKFVGNGTQVAYIPPEGTALPDCIASGLTDVAGAVQRTSAAIPTLSMAQDTCATLGYGLQISPDATEGQTLTFKLYDQNGSPITGLGGTVTITGFPGIVAEGRAQAVGRTAATGRTQATGRAQVIQ